MDSNGLYCVLIGLYASIWRLMGLYGSNGSLCIQWVLMGPYWSLFVHVDSIGSLYFLICAYRF